jgi:hypothetical protein
MPGHNTSARSKLVETSALPDQLGAVVCTLGGQPHKSPYETHAPGLDVPFAEDGPWDSGEEMDKYLNGRGGYAGLTGSALMEEIKCKARRAEEKATSRSKRSGPGRRPRRWRR